MANLSPMMAKPDEVEVQGQNAKPLRNAGVVGSAERGCRCRIGAPGGIRTPDQRLRKPLLYPAELQARGRLLWPIRPCRASPGVRGSEAGSPRGPGRGGRRAMAALGVDPANGAVSRRERAGRGRSVPRAIMRRGSRCRGVSASAGAASGAGCGLHPCRCFENDLPTAPGVCRQRCAIDAGWRGRGIDHRRRHIAGSATGFGRSPDQGPPGCSPPRLPAVRRMDACRPSSAALRQGGHRPGHGAGSVRAGPERRDRLRAAGGGDGRARPGGRVDGLRTASA